MKSKHATSTLIFAVLKVFLISISDFFSFGVHSVVLCVSVLASTHPRVFSKLVKYVLECVVQCCLILLTLLGFYLLVSVFASWKVQVRGGSLITNFAKDYFQFVLVIFRLAISVSTEIYIWNALLKSDSHEINLNRIKL